MPKRPHDKQRDTILDSIADGVFTVDETWRITSFNQAAGALVHRPEETQQR